MTNGKCYNFQDNVGRKVGMVMTLPDFFKYISDLYNMGVLELGSIN